jgi:hypothetical protein
LDRWLGGYRTLWERRFEALHAEIERNPRQRAPRRANQPKEQS